MAAPRKYSEELRERATRMALEAIADPATKHGAIRRIAAQLDVHPEALRTWVRLVGSENLRVNVVHHLTRPGTSHSVSHAARLLDLAQGALLQRGEDTTHVA